MGQISGELSNTVKKYGLSAIKPRHTEIARRLVLGQTQSEIARDLNMTPARLSVICASPIFKIEYNRLKELRDAGTVDISRELQEIAPGALEVIERTMYKGKTENIQFRAAESIMDRAGYSKINKTELSGKLQHNFSNHSRQELIDIVKERIQRMSDEENKTKLDAEKAKDIEVEWDDVKEPENVPETERKNEIDYGKEI